MNPEKDQLKDNVVRLATLSIWAERLEALRLVGRMVHELSNETHSADLLESHEALLAHAQWEREHGDEQILAPGTDDLAQLVDQLLNPVESVAKEVCGEHKLDGETMVFDAHPLEARAGGTTKITNGRLEYQGPELGTVQAKGAGTVLYLRGLVMDNITVQVFAGAMVDIEDCSFFGQYGGVLVRDAGSVVHIRESRFQTPVTASAGGTLTVVDSAFHDGKTPARDAYVSATGAGARVEMRGGTIARSVPGSVDYGASAYAGGSVRLQDVTISNCRVAVRALKDGSEVTLDGCRVEGKRTKTVAFAKHGGQVTLVKTHIGEEVRELSDCDEGSKVALVAS